MNWVPVVIFVTPFLVLLSFIAISYVSTYRKATNLELKNRESPYNCDGCNHHNSFHDKDGCNRYGTYNRCGCKKFISTSPEHWRALQELEKLSEAD